MSKLTLKITHLTSAHPRYDTRIFIKMCSSLAVHGYAVSLVVADGKGDEVKNGVSIFDVGAKTGGRLSRMTKTVSRVFEKAQELDADIYHLHDPELIPAGLKLKKLGKKVIFDIHENTGLQIHTKDWIPTLIRPMLSFLYESYENWACKKFDKLIVPQLAMQEKYRVFCSTELIGNFPGNNDLSPLPLARNYSKYDLLYSGGIGSARGLFNMLDLIVELKKRSKKFNLTIAGPISPEELENAKKHPGWAFTNYLGELSKEHIYDAYSSNSIGLILLNNVGQYYMAYSLKLFEYMQNGMLIIMPDFGDWVAFNQKNQVGLNVPVHYSKHIADVIDGLTESDFNNFGSNGIRLVETVFNWQSQEKILLNTYMELLNAK